MAGRSFGRAREPLVRSALLRPPRSVAVNHDYPISRFSVAPHALTLTRGTPRAHHVGFPVTRPGRGRVLTTAWRGDEARVGERGRCWPRGRDPPPSEDVQFVPMLTSFARPAGMLRQAFGPDRLPQTVRGRAASLSRPLPGRSGIRSPRAFRLRLASFSPSAPPNEVPGVRGSCAPVGSRLRALSPAGCRGRSAASAHLAGGSDPASALHGIRAGESSAETWPSPPVQRHPRGSNRVGGEGRVIGELSESAGQDGFCGIRGHQAHGRHRIGRRWGPT